MGYYTDYTLESDKDEIKVIPESLSDNYCVNSLLSCGDIGEVKWYSHIEDMIELSKANPEIKIITSGVGEEHNDIWEAEFLNGKHRIARAKIIEPCFDGVDWK